jgi:perosamine synthetase
LRYIQALSPLNNIQTPAFRNYTNPNWHLFPIRVEESKRENIYSQLRIAGFGVQVNYLPAHLHPVFRKEGFTWGDFPHSESYYRREISLPMWPGLLTSNEEYFENITSVLSKYS